MDKGVVEERGAPKEMIAKPQSPRTREFLSRVL
jgi:polar amino acid transport system ATP-binding protein